MWSNELQNLTREMLSKMPMALMKKYRDEIWCSTTRKQEVCYNR